MVVLEYDEERHQYYSLKDINKFKYSQDNDLGPDYPNSDFSIPLSEWKTHRLTPEQLLKQEKYALAKNRYIHFPVLLSRQKVDT